MCFFYKDINVSTCTNLLKYDIITLILFFLTTNWGMKIQQTEVFFKITNSIDGDNENRCLQVVYEPHQTHLSLQVVLVSSLTVLLSGEVT